MLPKIYFDAVSYPDSERSLQSRFKGVQLLLNLRADLGIIHMMLFFTNMQKWRVVELGRCLSRFQNRAEEAKQGSPMRAICKAVGIKQRTRQKVRDARNMNHLVRKTRGLEWTLLKTETKWTATNKAIVLGLLRHSGTQISSLFAFNASYDAIELNSCPVGYCLLSWLFYHCWDKMPNAQNLRKEKFAELTVCGSFST